MCSKITMNKNDTTSTAVHANSSWYKITIISMQNPMLVVGKNSIVFMMDYSCNKFGDCILAVLVLSCRQTDRHTQTRMIAILTQLLLS